MKTKYFGDINLENEKKITFQKGIFGFDEKKEYILKSLTDEDEGEDDFLMCLQSIDDADVAFLLMNPFYIMKEYDPYKVSNEIFDEIDLKDDSKHSVYCISIIKDELSDSTINLKCPVIINHENNQGIQYLLDTNEYSMKHSISDREV